MLCAGPGKAGFLGTVVLKDVPKTSKGVFFPNSSRKFTYRGVSVSELNIPLHCHQNQPAWTYQSQDCEGHHIFLSSLGDSDMMDKFGDPWSVLMALPQ